MTLMYSLLAAFGGGVFGTLIGGTTAFVFTGILALTGIAVSLAGGGDIILNEVAFGPFFGPHIAFVGGVAAAAYAGRKQKMQEGIANPSEVNVVMSGDKEETIESEELSGADTTIPLFKTNDPVVLLVGGVFGMIGYLTNELIVQSSILIDTVAFTVILLGIAVRFVFGKTSLFGKYPSTEKRFDFTPKGILFNGIWGFGLSAVVGYAAILLEINNIGFAISAISLIFVYFGLLFPVSHHISMVAGYAALAFGNVLLAAIIGLFATIAGDYIQRFVNTHVDTHVDMPAAVISLFSFVIFALS